jgi:hypothetical protein
MALQIKNKFEGLSDIILGVMGQVPVPFSVELRLLPNETTVTLRIFTDHTMAECFFQGGRTVITRSVGMRGRTKQAGVAVVSNVSVKLEAATAWRVSSIWVAPEDVLAAPRPDRHEP